MDKELEKISALYDGELTPKEMRETLKNLESNKDIKQKFKEFGVISDIFQRQSNQYKKNILYISNYMPKINPLITNMVTAAATVLVPLAVIYQLDSNRFQVDKIGAKQLSSAISSDEAKNQLLNADENIMEHMIHIMQSNESHGSQPLSQDWIPVGFSVNPRNPYQYSNGRNNLFFHLENKQLGITKVKYFRANNNWIYLIPLKDGRLLTAYGDVSPEVANPMIQAIYKRK